MKAKDVQKVLSTVHDTVGAAFDHMADRFAGGVESLGDDFAHLGEFSGSWKKLSKQSRKLFVDQLLKSSALVLAGAVAAKAGLRMAASSQKDLRKVMLNVADLIEPVAKKAAGTARKKTKKAKKRLKKTAG